MGSNWEKSDICLDKNFRGPRRQEQVFFYLFQVLLCSLLTVFVKMPDF